MALKGFTIYDLPAVSDPASELPGALLEVEVPAGPVAGGYVNKKLTIEQLASYLGATGGGTTPGTKLTAPANLRVVGTPTTSTVQLAWDTADFASSYTLQRATVSGGFTSAYSAIATQAGASYADGGRTAGTTYLYRVRANGTGDYSNSDYSAPIQVTMDGTAPSTGSVVFTSAIAS